MADFTFSERRRIVEALETMKTQKFVAVGITDGGFAIRMNTETGEFEKVPTHRIKQVG